MSVGRVAGKHYRHKKGQHMPRGYLDDDKRDDVETVSFENVHATAATDGALCVELNDAEVWIPHSQVHDDSEVYKKGDRGKLVITRWIAEKKGLV